MILAEDFDMKTGFVEVTVPNVFHGEDYSVTCESLSVPRCPWKCSVLTEVRTIVFARDDKPELESCSEKFKIDRDDKHRHKNCKDECKDDKDGKECCKDKGHKDGGY